MGYVTHWTAIELLASRPARKSFFARFLEAMKQARMLQAQREIARYRHLLPSELEEAGMFLSPRSEKDLPFIRD
jgi:hypothetical protein